MACSKFLAMSRLTKLLGGRAGAGAAAAGPAADSRLDSSTGNTAWTRAGSAAMVSTARWVTLMGYRLKENCTLNFIPGRKVRSSLSLNPSRTRSFSTSWTQPS